MRTAAATILAAALVLSPPAVAAPRNPAAALGLAGVQGNGAQGTGARGTGAQGTGTAGSDRTAGSTRQTLPVPGYKFIAGAMLLAIGGVIFAFTQQDGTPDSN